MRSTFFQQPFEYQIEIEGENWDQGGVIEGKLRVRNMSGADVTIKTVQLVLAHGLKKAIKEKRDVCWDIQEKLIIVQDLLLQPGGEESRDWNFNLSTDCPITDKQGSLFLLFGGDEVLSEGGRLDLSIQLHPILQNFLQTFKTQFRFLEKYQKRKADWTEVKLIPPDSREFPNMDYVLCFLRIHQELLEARYRFKMSGLGRSGQQMTITKKNREIEQIIPQESYLQPGGFPNRACFRENIDRALNIARPEVIF